MTLLRWLVLALLVLVLGAQPGCGWGGRDATNDPGDGAPPTPPNTGITGCGAGGTPSHVPTGTYPSMTEIASVPEASALAYRAGLLYMGSGNAIYALQRADAWNALTYLVLDASDRVAALHVYGNRLFCALRHITSPAQGRVVSIDLDAQVPVAVDVVTGLTDPRALLALDGYLYVAVADAIRAYMLADPSIVYTIADTSLLVDGVQAVDQPSGLDTDGISLFWCNGGTSDTVYAVGFDGTGGRALATLPAGVQGDLVIYGQHAYVCQDGPSQVHRIHLGTGLTQVVHAGATFTPGRLAFVNNSLFASSPVEGKVYQRAVSALFGALAQADYAPATDTTTYTLQGSFTVNNNWDEVGLQSGKVVLDGNSKTITILALNTDTLFFGGGPSSAQRLEIKNLSICATSDVLCALLRASGYVRLANVHLRLAGSILDVGGGLAYGSVAREVPGLLAYTPPDMEVAGCSAAVSGKVGYFAGPLLGCFSSGCRAAIADSFTMVLESNPDTALSSNATLDQGAGAFVGGSVGMSGGATLTRCYCLFSGSVTRGSGLLAGRYLGSSAALVLDRVYVVSSVQGVIQPDNPSDTAQRAYALGFFGAFPPSSITATDVNFLDLESAGLPIYGTDTALVSSLAGFTTHTSFASFDLAANAASTRVGSRAYLWRYAPPGGTTVTHTGFSPDSNPILYDVLLGPSASFP